MSERRLKEIEQSAEEIVRDFVEVSEGLPDVEETYYTYDSRNVVRPDGKASPERERKDFRKRFIKIMPGSDDEGNLRVEVAKWTE